jgi:hypothetical protein
MTNKDLILIRLGLAEIYYNSQFHTVTYSEEPFFLCNIGGRYLLERIIMYSPDNQRSHFILNCDLDMWERVSTEVDSTPSGDGAYVHEVSRNYVYLVNSYGPDKKS